MLIKIDNRFKDFKGEYIKEDPQIYLSNIIKYLVSDPIKTVEELKDQQKNVNDTILKDVILKSIETYPQLETQKGMKSEEKFKLFSLAQKISEADTEIELTVEEITKIKTAIGDVYKSILIVGQAFNYLECKSA